MTNILKIGLGIIAALWLVLAFAWLPDINTFPAPHLARIVALHLPNAFVVMVMAFVAGVYGVRYLRGRDLLDDAKSASAAGLAALFCILTTATGSVFARVQWGAFWNWDPKQIAIFILLLIYAAYFVLRAGVEDADKRGAVSAVYVLFATVMTPLLGYVLPKFQPSLHPTDTQLDNKYQTVIWLGTIALLGLAAWMQSLAVRAVRVRLRWAEREDDRDTWQTPLVVRSATNLERRQV